MLDKSSEGKDQSMDWRCLADHPDGVRLELKVVPNAARTEAKGLWQDRLRVRLKAPPVEGKANEALLRWVAQVFGLRAREVEILRGEKGSAKSLLLRGLRRDAAVQVLECLEGSSSASAS